MELEEGGEVVKGARFADHQLHAGSHGDFPDTGGFKQPMMNECLGPDVYGIGGEAQCGSKLCGSGAAALLEGFQEPKFDPNACGGDGDGASEPIDSARDVLEGILLVHVRTKPTGANRRAPTRWGWASRQVTPPVGPQNSI